MNLQIATTELIPINRVIPIKRSRRTKRIRRARMSYPAALVELALVLCGTADKRRVASVLGVGISTLYRWVGMHRTSWMPRDFLRTDGSFTQTADIISALSTRCERAGFRVSPALINRKADATRQFTRQRANELERAGTQDISAIDKVSVSNVIATDSMIRAKHEIDTKYSTRLSCQRLAAIAKMSRIKFIKEFGSTFGAPPYHYLLGIRVQRAIELLQYSSASLPIVAATTGFGSAASMQRAFKRFAGGSPGTVVKAIAPKRDLAFANSFDAQTLSAEKS